MQRKLSLLLFFNFVTLFLLNAQCVSGDCQNGTGQYLYPSGAKYIGQFKNGEIHGVGTCYYTDGTIYRGNWENRYPSGEGVKIFPDGTERKGLWEKGQPIDNNGNIIEALVAKSASTEDGTNIQAGCLQGNCQQGEGTYAYPDGSKYEGQFYNGNIDGWGTFFYPNDDKYVGAFRKGYSHGQGTFYRADGSVITGEWQNGEYIGDGKIAFGQVGCVQGDCVNGNGIYVYKGGEAKYEGAFLNNLPHGQGTITYANKENYTGQWLNGSFNGNGTLSLVDGSVVSGFWKDGAYQGKGDNRKEEIAQAPAQAEQLSDLNDVYQAEQVKVWAVIIGVASYNHMPTLKYTDDDAYRMYAFLKSPEGGALPDNQIRVLIDEDATYEKSVRTMREIFSQAGSNDLVMLYFSGHGLKGSFLPIDFDGFNNKLAHEEITAILKQSPAKYKLCIADACHSGSLLAMRSGTVQNTLVNYYTSLSEANPGTALIMSSKSDETSLESNNLRHGVFSHFLIRGLKGEADSNGNKVVTIKELYDFVSVNVVSYTSNRQSPIIKGDYDKKMTVSVVR